MIRKKTAYSGRRKRKKAVALPAGKTGPVYVRSTKSVGNSANTTRERPQYTRRANRKARAAGFGTALQYADHLLHLYEYAKLLKARMG